MRPELVERPIIYGYVIWAGERVQVACPWRVGAVRKARMIKLMSNEPKPKGEAETTINIVDALRGQQEQLKRLVAQPVWISKAPRSTLSDVEAQVTELRRLLAELEKVIQDQLRHS